MTKERINDGHERVEDLAPLIKEHLNQHMLFDFFDDAECSYLLSVYAGKLLKSDNVSALGIIEGIEPLDQPQFVVMRDVQILKKVPKKSDFSLDPEQHLIAKRDKCAFEICTIDLAYPILQ